MAGALEGDAVLLAGSTGRVGGALIATLLREGAHVLVLSRELGRAQAAVDAALPAPDPMRLQAFACDLTDPASAQAAVDRCVAAFGRLDAVVNLAGSGYRTVALVESNITDLRATMTSFVETAYNLSLPALRTMLTQPYRPGRQSRGRIVTVTAGSSKDPSPTRGLFGAAKAGVNVLMQAIAREHKADGIVANALVLGGVAFPGAERFRSPADMAAAATPQEVAESLTFLASDRCSGINGVLLDLNAREVD